MESTHITEVLQKTVVPLILSYMPVVVTVLVAWITISQLYFRKPDKSQVHDENEAPIVAKERKPIVAQSTGTIKSSKKKHQEKWSRDTKHNFSHEWLLTSLKGHTGSILDMEYSANGKYLATCADDDPGGTSGSSSGSEANKENNSPGRLSRRQKKNRIRKEDSSPPSKKKAKKEAAAGGGRKKTRGGGGGEEPHMWLFHQYVWLNLPEPDLFSRLREYTLRVEDLMKFGFPVESRLYPGRAMIFRTALDANAKEFVPREESVYASLLVQDSGEQLDRRPDSHWKKKIVTSEEKKCMRCSKIFFISSEGEYLTHEHCIYHWGKFQAPPSGGTERYFTCCRGKQGSRGCSTAKFHVWSGVEPGRNGPFDGYVRTRPRKNSPQDGNYGIYGLDCEMCFTNTGLELTKISVVAVDGRRVYETFVRPESDIIDYNTRFSGITAKDMSRSGRVKSLKEVQNDLMGFITADTILVGHGLENDLRALRMIHNRVVDTSIVFPHVLGPPYRRSLKSLVRLILKRDIQAGWHDSYEDACSCLELILWRLRMDTAHHRRVHTHPHIEQ